MAKRQDIEKDKSKKYIDFNQTEDPSSSSDDDFIPRKKQGKKLAKLVG